VGLPYGFRGTDQVECGYVTVPENRDDPSNNRTIKLAVVVMHPSSGNPLPDPVMYLDGGPGGAALNWLLQGSYEMFVKPILDTNRSVILFTQRGVAPAEPAIAPAPQCALTDAALSASNESTRADWRAAWSACFEELAKTTDLSAYHATAIAADANAIRQALGYEQVNLWGQSYGTRVGLTILRDYPDSVRAAVLSAPIPLDANEYDALSAYATALEHLFATCDTDARCRNIAPDLRATFFDMATGLNADPIIISRDFSGSGELIPYVIDGKRFTRLLPIFTWGLRYVPKLIMEASEGRYVEAMEVLSGPQWYYLPDNPPLVLIAACNEDRPFFTVDDMRAAVATIPEYAPLLYTDFFVPDFCALGNFRVTPPVENEPVLSDVPTLLLAGEFDYVSSPAYAEQAAATLDNAFVVTIPYAGHDLPSVGVCFYDILQSFLDDPTTAPNTTCLLERERLFNWGETLPSG
jgi:pimeloyl-ACP methyl ester carboxylesterase